MRTAETQAGRQTTRQITVTQAVFVFVICEG